MTEEFKVGDRVRCIEGSYSYGVTEGCDYTVEQVPQNGDLDGIYVQDDSGEVRWWLRSRFKKVEEGKKASAHKEPAPDVVPLDDQAAQLKKLVDADRVIRPAHYTQYPIEPVVFLMVNKIPFDQGNVIKYTLRADAKNGIEDLKKARRYLDMMIAMREDLPKFLATEWPKFIDLLKNEDGTWAFPEMVGT